jgi:hypothetical protein
MPPAAALLARFAFFLAAESGAEVRPYFARADFVEFAPFDRLHVMHAG